VRGASAVPGERVLSFAVPRTVAHTSEVQAPVLPNDALASPHTSGVFDEERCTSGHLRPAVMPCGEHEHGREPLHALAHDGDGPSWLVRGLCAGVRLSL
jgi:hypothetical protein